MVEWLASAIVATLALVLASAGVAKLSRAGGGRRAQGVLELIVAGAALAAPVRISGAGLTVVFAGFAAVHGLGLRHRAADGCDCFGEAAAPDPDARVQRLGLTATSAGLAAAAAVLGRAGPVSLVVQRPVSGLSALAAAALAAGLWQAAFTHGAGESRAGATLADEPPAGETVRTSGRRRVSERLVDGSALLLERRFSRRGLLVRLAAAGSALTVAPVRYLLYPGTALAAISPGECAGGACTDGYTAFCCQINQGYNSCPADTFPGGWWMCTDYPGRRLCADEGVRYYVDCNAMPGRAFPGGCRCAGGSCDNQRVACNVFRYGQCNTQIAGVTAVVCRMVVCENPSTIAALNCSASLAVDDAVCEQDTPCLEPAIQLSGAGGV